MLYNGRTYGVLIVSSSEKFNTSVAALLPEAYYSPVNIVRSVAAAERALLEQFYDFVFVNLPLPDDYGTRFAIDICNDKDAVVLVYIRAEQYEEIHAKVFEQGVFTLPKPTSAQMISQALEWMAATRERLRKLKKKTITIEEKMEEIRLVNRAKWYLIDKMKLTETEAHRYIEKQAMDRCKTRREIAENIIKTT